MVIGKQIDGIWHTGIVVYNTVINPLIQEYYFGGGICNGLPAQTPYGTPVKKIPLGKTEIPKEVFLDFLKDVSPNYSMATYNILTNNCNNFTDICAEFLLGEGIPRYIVDLPQEALDTPMGKQLFGMMGAGQQGGGNQLFDPRGLEGPSNPQAMNFNSQTTHGELGGVAELIGQANFEARLKNEELAVVDVYTEWCGPCKAIKPFFSTLPSKFSDTSFFKCDLDKNPFLKNAYGITSIPTFLYFNRGQLVKMQKGADQQSLSENVNWLRRTYLKQEKKIAINVIPNQIQKDSLGPYRYKPEGENIFFDDQKWDIPVSKLHEFFIKHSFYKNGDEHKELKAAMASHKTFHMATADIKRQATEIVLNKAPYDDPNNLLAFIDFLRLLVIEKHGSEFLAQNGEAFMERLLYKYFIKQDLPNGANPKAVYIITWRLIANCFKHDEGRYLILSVFDILQITVNKIFTEMRDNSALVKATVLGLNNIVFSEFGTDMEDKSAEELFKNLKVIAESTIDVTVVAALNIMCKLVDSNENLKKTGLAKNAGLDVQLQTLKVNKNKDIAMFAQDLSLLLAP